MNELMVGVLLRDVNVSSARSNSIVNEGRNDTSFMDILSSKMQDESSRLSKAVPSSPDRRKSLVSSQGTDKILKNNKSTSEKVPSDKTDKVSSAESKRKKEKDPVKKENLNMLLQFLQDLMSSLNVTPINTDNPDSVEATVSISETQLNQLQDVLGRLATLKNLVEELPNTELANEFTDIMKVLGELTDRTGNLEHDLTATVEKIAPELTELADQLKAQCSELIQKLQKYIASTDENEISADEALIDKAGELPAEDEALQGKETVSTEVEAEPVQEELPGSTITGKTELDNRNEAKAGQRKERHDNSNMKNEAEVSDGTAPDLNQQVNFGDLGRNDLQQGQGVADANRHPVSEALGKMQLPLTEKLMSQSVTNQVMMKVKLMAGENKQEMEMHLEPDTLGKLSLKIIHEKGEILAKITAESEQVKQILETNMQMLKDSLEKNGYFVQSLSVSVGNGRKEESQQQQQTGPESNYNIRRISGRKPEFVAPTETIYSPVNRDYFYGDSQINLTA